MLAKGNGNPSVCAQNLLKCVMGEVPYCRLKGLDPRAIGSPMSNTTEIKHNARTLISSCEPRCRIDDITVTGNAYGEFVAIASVTNLK